MIDFSLDRLLPFVVLILQARRIGNQVEMRIQMLLTYIDHKNDLNSINVVLISSNNRVVPL